ncbi:MAG: UDP-2,3-diacylglucosamine diphosphatase [Planctomycetota bacterium]|nr:UDP-2,3-diacylglucosamine diphosphatase [Planctomycetota bacterium]
MKARYRTLFISDCHLGSSGAKAEELARFLKQIDCDTIYLVGDVIDMWRLRQRWYWPDTHNSVMRRLLKMSHRGTTIVYVPGNHDEAARPFCGLSFGGMQMAMEAVHVTADGRRLLVTHGDQFDLVVRNSRLLALAGTLGYEMLLKINGAYNFGRRLFGLPYDSLSQAIKARVKSACNFISNFEQALVAEARAGGFDGVVCGHIHKAEQRMIGTLEYLNCGDWVESCTALVEHEDGRIELLDGLAFLAARDAAKAIADNSGDDSDETDPWLQRGVAFDATILLSGDAK